LVPGKPLVYGQSITDACIDWSETHGLLTELAAAVRSARGASGTGKFRAQEDLEKSVRPEFRGS